MEKEKRRWPEWVRARVRFWIAAYVVWLLYIIPTGLLIGEQPMRHAAGAGWWFAMIPVFLLAARRMPPPPARGRAVDWLIALLVAHQGATYVLRATLGDSVAFGWTMGLMAVNLVAAFVIMWRLPPTPRPTD